MRRPHYGSKLEALTQEQKRQLCEWLLTPGLTYAHIIVKIAKEFRLKISRKPLTRFFKNYCEAELIRRRVEAVSGPRSIAQQIENSPGQWDAATLDALKQKIFELSLSPEFKPTEVMKLYHLILKGKEQELEERRVKAIEEQGTRWPGMR